MIYHIATRQAWEQAQVQGAYTADSLESEGFIHCSTSAQVEGTANRFYHGQGDLVLLHVDDQMLASVLKYENLEGGEGLFPHIYAALPLAQFARFKICRPIRTVRFTIMLTKELTQLGLDSILLFTGDGKSAGPQGTEDVFRVFHPLTPFA